MAGAVRSRETTGWRACTGPRRSGCRGHLRDTVSSISWRACDCYCVRTQPYVRIRLGAAQVIDYRAVRFEDNVRDMDVVFDTVGGKTLQRSWAVLKPGGRMITIAADSETTTDDRVKQAFFIVEPNREQLTQIGSRWRWAISSRSWTPCCRWLERPRRTQEK